MSGPIEILDTVYGKMLVLSTDISQYRALKYTAKAIDHDVIMRLAELAQRLDGPRAFLDIGSCFGTYTLALAPHFEEVHAFEPQRPLAHCIAGSVALNDLSEFVHVHNVAIGAIDQPIAVPKFDYNEPLNFGSVEFGPEQTEQLTQRRQKSTEFVSCQLIDNWRFGERIGLMKIDAEGMDEAVLRGAIGTIKIDRPIIFVEFLKNNADRMAELLTQTLGYNIEKIDMNFLCFPKEMERDI